MRRVAMLMSAVAVVVFAAGVYAQAPNFSGKWAIDTDKMAAAMGAAGGGGGRMGGRGGGGPITITQDAKTLTITRTTQAGESKTVYNLDGSESKNQMMGRGGAAATEVVSHAKWDGAKLVITTTTAGGEQVQSWYMEGANLVNETTRQGNPFKTYYKKAE